MSYVCFKCGKKIKDIKNIRCPYCGGRLIFKERPPVAKKVRAL